MIDKLIQALTEAALAATHGDWHADDAFISYSVTCVVNGWNREIARIDGPNAKNDLWFIAVASPQNILRVLAEREADKLLIAELLAERDSGVNNLAEAIKQGIEGGVTC